MANDVKWIKITTDMFDNRKIKHLRRLPEGNNIVLLWVMLLTMAGRCNANGMVFLTENIPYTPKMLADELDFEENTVKMGLQALAQLNMIVTDNDFFYIAGWEEHQNAEGMEKIREQNRKRVAAHREKQKLFAANVACNVTGNVTVTQSNATEEDIDKEKEEDKELRTKGRGENNYQLIADMYNEICVSFPRLKSLSEARKKAVKARLNTYSVEDFKTMFEMAEASPFLKGANDRNWTATFDWMIKDSNMAKVLEGNYADRQKPGKGRKEAVPDWMERDNKKEIENMRRMHAAMAGNNPDVAAKAEALKRELQGG